MKYYIVIYKEINFAERPLLPSDLVVTNQDGTVKLFNSFDEIDEFVEWSIINDPFVFKEADYIYFT